MTPEPSDNTADAAVSQLLLNAAIAAGAASAGAALGPAAGIMVATGAQVALDGTAILRERVTTRSRYGAAAVVASAAENLRVSVAELVEEASLERYGQLVVSVITSAAATEEASHLMMLARCLSNGLVDDTVLDVEPTLARLVELLDVGHVQSMAAIQAEVMRTGETARSNMLEPLNLGVVSDSIMPALENMGLVHVQPIIAMVNGPSPRYVIPGEAPSAKIPVMQHHRYNVSPLGNLLLQPDFMKLNRSHNRLQPYSRP